MTLIIFTNGPRSDLLGAVVPAQVVRRHRPPRMHGSSWLPSLEALGQMPRLDEARQILNAVAQPISLEHGMLGTRYLVNLYSKAELSGLN